MDRDWDACHLEVVCALAHGPQRIVVFVVLGDGKVSKSHLGLLLNARGVFFLDLLSDQECDSLGFRTDVNLLGAR
jgi:hypothetical protein